MSPRDVLLRGVIVARPADWEPPPGGLGEDGVYAALNGYGAAAPEVARWVIEGLYRARIARQRMRLPAGAEFAPARLWGRWPYVVYSEEPESTPHATKNGFVSGFHRAVPARPLPAEPVRGRWEGTWATPTLFEHVPCIGLVWVRGETGTVSITFRPRYRHTVWYRRAEPALLAEVALASRYWGTVSSCVGTPQQARKWLITQLLD